MWVKNEDCVGGSGRHLTDDTGPNEQGSERQNREGGHHSLVIEPLRASEQRCDIIRDVLQEDGFGELAQCGLEGEEANCVPGTGQC